MQSPWGWCCCSVNLSPLNCSVKMSPMRKRVTLTVKEQKRLKVIIELDAGRMKAREAAEMLGLSVRQVRRLVAAYRKEGAASLAHGNRGRRSVHRISEEVRDRILELARGPYHDYNDTHFAEKLGEQHGILVSRSTVRRLRRSIGRGARGSFARHAIVADGNDIRCQACCFRSTAASTIGSKAEGHPWSSSPPSTMPPTRCPMRSFDTKKTPQGTSS